MNGRVFSSPVAGFSMTHMSGSKCSMISESSRAHRQSSADHVKVPETARSPSSG